MGKVPFYTKCSCNPENGGSGICGCTMANTMIEDGQSDSFGGFYSTTCPKCQKIIVNEEGLYWHLKQHNEGLI